MFTGKIIKLLDRRARDQMRTEVYLESKGSFIGGANQFNYYRFDFSSSTSIVVAHNLGHRPLVQLQFNNGGSWFADTNNLYDIEHDSINQFTVTLSIASDGEVIFIG